ncbi:MAG: CHAD domain-containing protein [Microthrixaceae bacterium]
MTADGWRLGPEDRDQPAGRVLAVVLDGQLAAFLAHEPGVRADEDPEELHDARVAVRRARSLLAAGRRVYPAEERELLAALLRWMAGVTSPVRDLDVLREDLPGLAARLSPELSDGIEPLLAAFDRERATALAALFAAMDSERYPVLLRRWRALGNVYRVGGGEPGPDASRPAGQLADDLVWRAFRRARRAGRVAMDSDDRDAWHDLRKALKRYRYVVNAVAPMYPKGTFGPVQRRLADLQDTLGRLQDHHVQASMIERAGAVGGGRAALAAGALADALHHDAEVAHAHCRDAWAHFDRPKVRLALREAVGR